MIRMTRTSRQSLYFTVESRFVRRGFVTMEQTSQGVLGAGTVEPDNNKSHRSILNGRDTLIRPRMATYCAALRMTSDLILFLHPESLRIIEANETACSMLGYSRSELLTIILRKSFHSMLAMDWLSESCRPRKQCRISSRKPFD